MRAWPNCCARRIRFINPTKLSLARLVLLNNSPKRFPLEALPPPSSAPAKPACRPPRTPKRSRSCCAPAPDTSEIYGVDTIRKNCWALDGSMTQGLVAPGTSEYGPPTLGADWRRPELQLKVRGPGAAAEL